MNGLLLITICSSKTPKKSYSRIANFIGLPDAKIGSVAKLVATKRRHTHFTIDQLIDARVSGEVIELYRTLIAEASGRKDVSGKVRPQSEINRKRYTPRLSEPARCLHSRPLCTNRASLWRAPRAN